jgi:EpsI family protein
MKRRSITAAVILAVALGLKTAYQAAFRIESEVMPTRIPLAQLAPEMPGTGWKGRAEVLEEATRQRAGVTEYVNSFYERQGNRVWFYVGYYDGSRIESIHQPMVCLPGSGWKLESSRVEVLEIPGVGETPFNVAVFSHYRARRLAAYTFFYKGAFAAAQSAVESGRIFGDRHFAIVQLSSDVLSSEEATWTNCKEIIGDRMPKLMEHFPASAGSPTP